MQMKCYCGSGANYSHCCKPLIDGERNAQTPEMLMRARYSAYASGNTAFIAQTHDPDTQDDFDEKGAKEWADRAEWLGLEIVSAGGDGPDDDKGHVEFIARYKEDGNELAHHERSVFVKKRGSWYFSAGRMIVDQVQREGEKVGRNDPCPCGSGKKYKKCCGR